MVKQYAILVLLITAVSSLRVTNWTTISTNFKPTVEKIQAKHDAQLTTQVQNLVNLASDNSDPHTHNTPPTLLLQLLSSHTSGAGKKSRVQSLRKDSTTTLLPSDTDDTDANAMSSEEIKRNIADINAAKGSIAKMVGEVSDSITSAEVQFKAEREGKLQQLKEAKILQATQDVSEDYKMIKASENRVKLRRKAINHCLKMIYGGSNKFYWHMRAIL